MGGVLEETKSVSSIIAPAAPSGIEETKDPSIDIKYVRGTKKSTKSTTVDFGEPT